MEIFFTHTNYIVRMRRWCDPTRRPLITLEPAVHVFNIRAIDTHIASYNSIREQLFDEN